MTIRVSSTIGSAYSLPSKRDGSSTRSSYSYRLASSSGSGASTFLCANGGIQPTPSITTSGISPPARLVVSFSFSALYVV